VLLHDQPEVGKTANPSRRQLIIDWARRILMLLVVAAATYAVVERWPAVRSSLLALTWWQVTLSIVLLMIGVLLGMLSWRAVVVGIAHPGAGRKLGQVYLIGQMGKYVPGAVWAFLLQMEVGRKNGVARAQVFVAALVSTGITVGASVVVGMLALPYLAHDEPRLRWLYLLLPVTLLGMHPAVVTSLVNLVLRLLRKPSLDRPLTAMTIVRSFVLASAMYMVYGVHLWILIRVDRGVGIENALFFTGALALGMSVGLFAFLLPSGIGAREAVVVAALSTVVPTGSALAIALLSRAMFTVAELICMGLAFLDFRRSPGLDQPEVDDRPSAMTILASEL
jgi:glycosyltransferase 2 family protein